MSPFFPREDSTCHPVHACARRAGLERLLLESSALWGASTFREQRPAWCASHPHLTAALLALEDSSLAALAGDSGRALAWLAPELPILRELAHLASLPQAPAATSGTATMRTRGIPGRKVGQIQAFVAVVGKPMAPLVEWCAGKGHLGRQFLSAWGGDGLAVERNASLCAAGRALAVRAGIRQCFKQADVLEESTAGTLHGAHAIALHACGDLHEHLITSAVEMRAPAIDVAPCCYHLIADNTRRPRCADSRLELDRLALKLAVTDTVTASPREIAGSARASAWKLAFLALREAVDPCPTYRPFRPVPARWHHDGFPAFLIRLAGREGLPLPKDLDFPACEANGWQRYRESSRLQLVRMAFRRALEVWLLCDLAAWLENQGYTATLAEFCPRTLTPRNLLLSARL